MLSPWIDDLPGLILAAALLGLVCIMNHSSVPKHIKFATEGIAGLAGSLFVIVIEAMEVLPTSVLGFGLLLVLAFFVALASLGALIAGREEYKDYLWKAETREARTRRRTA